MVGGGRTKVGSVETVDVKSLILGSAPPLPRFGVIENAMGVVTVVVALVRVVEAVIRASGTEGEETTDVGT